MKVAVTKAKVEIIENEAVNSGEYLATTLKFEFSDVFDNLVKKAVFTVNKTPYEVVVVDNKCELPPEILRQNGVVTLGVYGYALAQDNETYELRVSPKPTSFSVNTGSYDPTATQSEEITPTQFEQYEAQLNSGLDKLNTVVEEVEKAIEEGDYKGDKGDQGEKGEPGQDGEDGEDGVGIASVEQTTTSHESEGENVVTVTKTDGTSSTFSVFNGARGAQGERGEPGETGETGEPGATGADGFSPRVTLTQVDDTTASLTIVSQDADGNQTTQTASFGGTWTNADEESY